MVRAWYRALARRPHRYALPAGQTTLKEPERVKAFQSIEQRLVGEAVVVPIQHIRWIFGSRPRAHGLKYHPIHGIYKLMDVWVV